MRRLSPTWRCKEQAVSFPLRPKLNQGRSDVGGRNFCCAVDVTPSSSSTPFEFLSKSVHRGFKFDRIGLPDGKEPLDESEKDQMAMASMKTTDIPPDICNKIVRLLKDFGHKKEIQRYGRHVSQKIRSRTSSEIPKVLSSRFLPEQEGRSEVDRLQSHPAFEGENIDDESYVRRLALAHAEDSKHKLYQMFWSPHSALAYLAHRYTSTFASCFRILYEVQKRCPDFHPKRVLDYGAGPAPGLAAMREFWGDDIEYMLAVEPSAHMQQLGQYLTADFPQEVDWQAQLYEVEQSYDLIVVSYVMLEVRGQSSRDMLVKKLWNRLRPEGILVLCEPGTPTGFRFIHHARELFISDLQQDDFHFVAPCPHEKMCPLAITGRDWCHFGQRVMRLSHRVYCKGSTAKFWEEEKFSYLVTRKSRGPRSMYKKESLAPTAHEKSYFWPRIIMPAIKAGGHTLVDVCSAPSNFERLSISRSKPHGFGYRRSRKILWGDLWQFAKRVNRPQARAYIPKETQEHLDRLAKRAYETMKQDDQGFRRQRADDVSNYGK
eukprot:GEMP01004977.1.p1 GENE.GEMP01004977.1~~GEMP01004977.1.p1  ORF type:complete len:545 (+),score=91.24 GEMP01004977.1:1691-3325(+)